MLDSDEDPRYNRNHFIGNENLDLGKETMKMVILSKK